MLTAIKGIYHNGQVVLHEAPPTENTSQVIVTFLEEISTTPSPRRLGSLKGKIGIPDDFNEPLDDLKEYMF